MNKFKHWIRSFFKKKQSYKYSDILDKSTILALKYIENIFKNGGIELKEINNLIKIRK